MKKNILVPSGLTCCWGSGEQNSRFRRCRQWLQRQRLHLPHRTETNSKNLSDLPPWPNQTFWNQSSLFSTECLSHCLSVRHFTRRQDTQSPGWCRVSFVTQCPRQSTNLMLQRTAESRNFYASDVARVRIQAQQVSANTPFNQAMALAQLVAMDTGTVPPRQCKVTSNLRKGGGRQMNSFAFPLFAVLR